MSVTLQKGYLVLWHCFDVATEVQLDWIEKFYGDAVEAAAITCQRVRRDDIKYAVPPLRLKQGAQQFKAGKRVVHVEWTDIKIYDYGALAIRYWVPLRGKLKDQLKLVEELTDHPDLAKAARAQVTALQKELSPAFINPTKLPPMERYAAVYAQSFDTRITAQELLRREGGVIGTLLACESQRMSDLEIEDALRNPISYFPDDLVLVDWAAAFIYDRMFSMEAVEIIEYAVVELLEHRVYDKYLDVVLGKAYDDMTVDHGMKYSPFSATINELAKVRLEVSEMVDKVQNALKLVGDQYLAKVHQRCIERFAIERWRQNVSEKLHTVLDTYQLLSDQREAHLMLVLEIIIVLLFVVDIALYFFG